MDELLGGLFGEIISVVSEFLSDAAVETVLDSASALIETKSKLSNKSDEADNL